jgi:hypothetical protein
VTSAVILLPNRQIASPGASMSEVASPLLHLSVRRLPNFKTINYPQYRTESALCRDMDRGFTPPPWPKAVIVVWDAAYDFQDGMPLVMQRAAADAERT